MKRLYELDQSRLYTIDFGVEYLYNVYFGKTHLSLAASYLKPLKMVHFRARPMLRL